MSQSDFISLHCALTPQTKHLISKEALSLMKPTSFVINTSRGPVVDMSALTEFCQQKKIGGAGLDVTDPEPLPASHPILKCDNVVVLPHIASASVRTRQKMSFMTAENVIAALEGKKLPHCVPGTQ